MRPPRIVTLVAVLVLLLGIAAPLRWPASELIGRTAALLVCALGGGCLARWVTRRPSAVTLRDDGRVYLLGGNGEWERARLARPPRVLPLFIEMPFDRRTRSGRALVVTPDMTRRSEFRRLSRWLRTMNHDGGAC